MQSNVTVSFDDQQVAAEEKRVRLKVRRFLLTYFIFGMIFVQMDKTSIGFAQLTMGKELALSATIFGFASGIFSLASFLMQIPASVLFEKLGARVWLTSSMVLWGLVCIAQAFVHNGTQLSVLRFLLGASEAGFLPGLFILINIWFSEKQHGMAVSAVQIGTAAAGALSGSLAGVILSHPILPLSGWRNLFLIEGFCTVLFAAVTALIVADNPQKASWLSENEKIVFAEHGRSPRPPTSSTVQLERGRLVDVIRDPRVLLLTASYFCAGWAAGTFTFFTPLLLKNAARGASVSVIGFLTIVPYLVNVLVAFTWGAHADRHNERHWHTTLPLLVSLLGIVLYPRASSSGLALLALVLVQAGNTGFYVNFWATCTTILGRTAVVRSTAVINAGSAASTFLAPIVFGWVMDRTHAYTFGLYICGAVILINFFLMNAFFFSKSVRQRFASD